MLSRDGTAWATARPANEANSANNTILIPPVIPSEARFLRSECFVGARNPSSIFGKAEIIVIEQSSRAVFSAPRDTRPARTMFRGFRLTLPLPAHERKILRRTQGKEH